MIGKLIKVVVGGAILFGLASWAGMFTGCNGLSIPALPSISLPSVGNQATDSGNLAIHYAPEENLERVDLQQLSTLLQRHGSGRKQLDVAMYAFTDQVLGAALVQLADAGYTIRVYRDGAQYEEETERGGAVQRLFQENPRIHVRLKPAARSLLMHLKAYSDGAFVREGSANWSPAGEKRQDNSLLITYQKREIDAFERKFDAMWNRTDNVVIQ